MAFRFSDKHIQEYHTQGYTVFEGVLPPSLIDDLRRVTDEARDIARKTHGPQAQRLQPISNYPIDQKPFDDFRDLPELHDAFARLLGPRHTHGNTGFMGVLLEPADEPWCTQWHRDWRDNINGLNLDRWDEVFSDINLFNQINCALYDDNCTWVVPGSHLRRDLPGEIERFPTRPVPGPNLEGQSPAQRERTALEYCRSLPGAVCLQLRAGDLAIYRNSLWHLGNYVPYCKRATLHDSADTPEFMAWRERVLPEAAQRVQAGYGMSNPNFPELNLIPDKIEATA